MQGITSPQTWARYGLVDRLVSKFRTRNMLMGTLISLVLIDSNVITKLVEWVTQNIPKGSRFILVWIFGLFKRRRNKIDKTCSLMSITPDRELCTIFLKVLWYLREQTEFKTINNVVIHKSLKDMDVVQSVPKATQSTIDFKDTKIEYKVVSELTTIYADREYKREMQKTMYFAPTKTSVTF